MGREERFQAGRKKSFRLEAHEKNILVEPFSTD